MYYHLIMVICWKYLHQTAKACQSNNQNPIPSCQVVLCRPSACLRHSFGTSAKHTDHTTLGTPPWVHLKKHGMGGDEYILSAMASCLVVLKPRNVPCLFACHLPWKMGTKNPTNPSKNHIMKPDSINGGCAEIWSTDCRPITLDTAKNPQCFAGFSDTSQPSSGSSIQRTTPASKHVMLKLHPPSPLRMDHFKKTCYLPTINSLRGWPRASCLSNIIPALQSGLNQVAVHGNIRPK